MKLQQIDSKNWSVTIKPDHLRIIMSAARHILDDPTGRIPTEAEDCLREEIDSFDNERGHLCDVKDATARKKN